MRIGARAAFLALAFLALLAVPAVARRGSVRPPRGAATVIVVTPHPEEIRIEFAQAFAAWHRARFGEDAAVVWSTPGGAGDIRRLLEAGALAALRQGQPIGGGADVLFGGGSYEYEQLKRPLSVEVDGVRRSGTVLEPLALDPALLAECFGDGMLAGRPLRDPEGYWFGTALSSFGLVFNAELLADRGVAVPGGWDALADPRLRGLVAMANPAQSASIASAMDTVLQREGWERGWAILRRAAGNARSISASAPRAPIDVGQGDAALAMCIDFYGRAQEQAVSDGGSPGRIAYVDPVGRTTVDPDPVALLRGAPHPEHARRFVEFVLSAEGQRLWQFVPGTEGGPRRHALRRLPVRRDLLAREGDRFMDRVDPAALVGDAAVQNPDVRAFVAPMFVAVALENRDLLREAWALVASHPEYPRDGRVLLSSEARSPELRAMLAAFDAPPRVPAPGGRTVDLRGPEDLRAVRDGWLRGGWKDAGLWDPADAPADALRRALSRDAEARLREVIAVTNGGRA